MKPDEIDILDLIPQRPPIVMVDKLLQYDDFTATTSLFISPENIFVENGFFSEPGLIENIAQTAAAKMGYQKFAVKSSDESAKPQIGYIASVKNLIIHFLPGVNTEITTEIKIDNEVLGFILLNGKVLSAGKVAAECELRVFLAPAAENS